MGAQHERLHRLRMTLAVGLRLRPNPIEVAAGHGTPPDRTQHHAADPIVVFGGDEAPIDQGRVDSDAVDPYHV